MADDHRDTVQGGITLDELFTAIKSFANDVIAEFYQTFFSVIGKKLLEVINDGFKRGELSLSMRRGVIVLIWKGYDTRLLKKNGDIYHF